MDRIAILTRTSAINFGTILQSYALQKYITSLSKKVLVVDDCQPRRVYQEQIHSKEDFDKGTIKEKIARWLDGIKLKRKYARSYALQKRIDIFKKKNMEYFYTEDISALNRQFDVFVSGSDQIWAYAAEPKLFPFFLQESIDDDKKKVSYAVSVGERRYPCKYTSVVQTLLGRFDYISVREETSKQVLCQYTNREIDVVCDPVFLLNGEQWKALAGKRKIKRKYIFCYFLSDNFWYSKKIKELTMQLNYDVYVFRKSNMLDNGCKNIKLCTPEEFLNYIEFAEFVLTDSYHAFLFSMIFGKTFNVLERFEANVDNIQNARIQDLMKRLNISGRFLTAKDDLTMSELDYSYVDSQIKVFKEYSKEFLRKSLCKAK